MLQNKRYQVSVFLALFVGPGMVPLANGQTSTLRYVRPSIEVPVRRGQGTEFKIIKLVKDGERVELLKEAENWAKVRVGKKVEGWLPKRFLSKEAPPVQQIKTLQQENNRLKEENEQLSSKLQEVQSVQATTGGELTTCIQERDNIRSQYTTLQTDTADVMAVKRGMETAQKKMVILEQKFKNVQQQNDDLKRKTALTWFLAGGGVLLIGWIIGLITCRSKRRRPSLM